MCRIAALLLTALVLSGCGEQKLDGSSDDALKKSVAKVSESLPPEKKAQFEKDIQLIAISKLDIGGVLKGKSSIDDTGSSLRSGLNGKTASDIATEAQRIRMEREAREREQALSEIKELLIKKQNADAAHEQLSKFTVSKSRFFKREEKYSYRPKPIIELTVHNGTNKAISRAYFKGVISSAGREIPWFSNSFNYEIAGGLEPGETANWTLAPNMFSDWGSVDAPRDAVFTVEVYRLDGSNKEALYDSEGLTDREVKRLAELQAKYAEK